MWRRWTRHWRLSRRPTKQQRAADQSDANEKKTTTPPSTMTTKKPSPTKTRTGNALAQFVILSALTVVAYQFIASRLYAASPPDTLPVASSSSPSPWTDAALEKYRAKQRAADREVISTTEFSCFMACIGLFGLMQRKKKRSEQEAIEAQRRAVEARVLRHRDGHATLKRSASDESAVAACLVANACLARASTDALAALPNEVQLELLSFLAAEDLVECAMVSHAWQDATGDLSERLWSDLFMRDFGESGERFVGLVPRICWRQYYFLHRLSRAVELARWLDATEQRRCVVIQGHVYDVTSFLDAHPGGYHVIGDVLGTDATELWDQFQHSSEAKELMKDFLVEDDVLAAMDPRTSSSTTLPQKNLAVVKNRWRQITWCINHAHLLGGLSGPFLDAGFRFVVWRTTRPRARC